VISLVFSSTHLSCAQWTQIKHTHLISGIATFPLLYNLSEVFDNESDVNSLINSAIGQVSDKFSLEGQEILITMPRSLVLQDVITIDEGLSALDTKEFVEWQTRQHFGNIASNWESIIQPHPWNKQNYLIQWIPTYFKSLLKLTLEEKGAKPVWLGADYMALLPLDPTIQQALVIPENNGYSVLAVDEDTFRYGSVFFSTKEGNLMPRTTERGNLDALFDDSMSSQFEFLFTSQLNENRQKHWENCKTSTFDLLTGVSIEGVEFNQDDYSPYYLQALAGTIVTNYYQDYENYLDVDTEAIKDVAEDLEAEKSIDEWEESRVRTHDEPAQLVKEATQKKISGPIIAIAILALAALLYIFTPISSFSGFGNDQEDKAIISWQKYYNQSEAIRNTAESFVSNVTIDSIYILVLSNNAGRIAWTGSQDLPGISGSITSNWIVEEFEDTLTWSMVNAGAFSMNKFNYSINVGKQIDPQGFIEILKESVPSADVLPLKYVKLNRIEYLPVLVEVESGSNLLQVFDIMKSSGDNVVLRKLELVNSGDPESVKKIRAYLSVFN